MVGRSMGLDDLRTVRRCWLVRCSLTVLKSLSNCQQVASGRNRSGGHLLLSKCFRLLALSGLLLAKFVLADRSQPHVGLKVFAAGGLKRQVRLGCNDR